MNRPALLLTVAILLLFGSEFVYAAAPDAEGVKFFERKIRPLLAKRCYKCHSSRAKKQQGGLHLDSRQAILAGGDSGPALVPGKIDDSRLIHAVRYTGDEVEMPPTGKLPESEIALLVEWVRRGAPYPAETITAKVNADGIDFPTARKFWSFQMPKKSQPTVVDQAQWSRQPIDAFILAELKKQNLAPSSQADRRTLIRRATFDLIGLPPTPEEVEAFVSDDSKDAYPQLIERLLESPHYGERWGRMWLDMARYSDATAPWLTSIGQAYLYRDWVVQAFNDDMPYNDFVRRQLATDMMTETGPEDSPALGFLGLSPRYWKELKLDKDVIKVVVAEEWEERIDVIGRTFLGLTVACARCHDHKFDPISSKDYYALAGVLVSTRMVDRSTLPEAEARQAEQGRNSIKQAEAEIKKLEDALKAKKSNNSLDDRARLVELRSDIKHIRATTPNIDVPLAHGLTDASLYVMADGPNHTKLEYKPGVARDLPVFLRGSPTRPGPIVPRRFLEVFSDEKPQPFRNGSGRLELAEAIVGQAAPLSARVIVNRIWKQHFGQGLVATPSNFGTLGSPPTHPELLDDLTARFIENGWSIKWLHRQIMLSATYQQSSDYNADKAAIDADNHYLWRMNRTRLSVEAWRDAMLSASGTLDLKIGGPSIALDKANNHRRTIYAHVSRRDLHNMLRLYDFPDPTSHSPKRERTTTPLQQLFVLNGSFIQRQASALATRIQKEFPGDLKAQVQRAYQLLFGRTATSEQVLLAEEFLTADQKTRSPQRWQNYLQVLLGSNEFAFVD